MKTNKYGHKAYQFLAPLALVSLASMPLAVISCAKYQYDPQYDHLANLRGQGSSSIASVMQEVQNSVRDFQYEGSGSGDGLKVGTGQIKGKDFGMTSSLKHPSDASLWQKTRTVTWAIDAIAIILKLPPALNAKFTNDQKPVINGTELGKLYDLDPNNDDSVTWKKLLIIEDSENWDDISGINEPVHAQGRTGGTRTSGTAEGFFSHLSEVSGIDEQNLAHEHQSLPADHQTAEANSAALMALEGRPQGLTYVSLGYGLKQEADNNVFKVATIQLANNQKWVPSRQNVENGSYPWTRPFNVIYHIDNLKSVAFADFLLTNVQNILESLNLFALTSEQIKKQKVDLSLKTPDIEIVSDVTKDILGLAV